MAEDALEGMMIPGHRLLVVNDLGPVHKGDHVVMVANVIVAVDTSRRPEDVNLPTTRPYNAPPGLPRSNNAQPSASPMKRKYKRDHSDTLAAISSRKLWNIICDKQPISSMAISDNLGLDRNDLPARGKVSRVLRVLLQEGRIIRHQDEQTQRSRYVTADYIQSSVAPDAVDMES